MSEPHYISLIIFNRMDLENLEWKLNKREQSQCLCLSGNLGDLTKISVQEGILTFKGTLGEIRVEFKDTDIQQLIVELKKIRGV